MIRQITAGEDKGLWQYFQKLGNCIPYYFTVPYTHWQKSMFADTDYDEKALFTELFTCILEEQGVIQGFIQYGLTAFVFGEDGERDYTRGYAVVRNLHYSSQAQNAHLLLDAAVCFFNEKGCRDRYAFFHYFGMGCYARQGKLHASGFYMEALLYRYGFHKEHENVYYTRGLTEYDKTVTDIDLRIGKDGRVITFLRNGEAIGDCEIERIAGTTICYLRWIGIREQFARQGLGTKSIYRLFSWLQEQGITRLDTDTADSNNYAQKFYLKTGFTDRGIMRSYFNL